MRKKALSLAVLLLCAGCGTSAEPDYYSLAPVAGTPLATPVSLKIERPALPAYLDRPEIVRQSGAYGIRIDSGSRWAEPLDTMFERVLAEDLRQRMPSARIVTERDDALADPRFTLENDVEAFNDSDGGIVLQSYVVLRDAAACPDAVLYAGEFRDAAETSIPAGLSETIGRLADFAAQKLTLAAPCPKP